jgi:hypothetical protein
MWLTSILKENLLYQEVIKKFKYMTQINNQLQISFLRHHGTILSIILTYTLSNSLRDKELLIF